MVAERLRRLRPPRGGIVVVVAAAVIVAAVLVWVTRRDSGPSYRTATAQLASVHQTLDSVGTVSSATKISAAFPVAGTVASVAVSLGQKVSAGQRLARLDAATLQQQVDSASDTLASARQALADAENGELTSASSSSTALGRTGNADAASTDSASTDSDSAVQLAGATTAPAASASPTAPTKAPTTAPGEGDSGGKAGGTSGKPGSGAAGVTGLQQQVIAQQQRIDADLLTLRGPDGKTGLLGQANACTTGDTADEKADDTAGDGTGDTADCSTLLQQVADLENTIASEQAAQQQNEVALDKAITALQTSGSRGNGNGNGAGSSTGSTGRQGSTGHSGAGSSSGGGAGSSGASGGGQTVSAAQLAADQAHVDAAKANLTLAKQNLAAAVLTSPITGTVADVSISTGQRISAGSSDATITVIGGGAARVETTVALSDIDLVKVGDVASVDVDGVSTPLSGTVSSIGVLNTTTGSSTTFPVTVQLSADSPRLYDGVSAGVSITVATVTNALTVPTSAVHALGALRTVTVLESGKARAVQVKIGAADGERTQITSGLRAGQQVVLADLSEPLPTNDTTNRFGNGLTGGGTVGLVRFGGGGGPAGR